MAVKFEWGRETKEFKKNKMVFNGNFIYINKIKFEILDNGEIKAGFKGEEPQIFKTLEQAIKWNSNKTGEREKI